jgi:hypothetical protein
MRHHTNEVSFERPDWLLDRTNHLFTVAADGPSPFNLVLSHTLIEDETLDEVTDRILRDLKAVLDDFVVGTPEEAMVAGEHARILQFQWQQNGRQLYQRQAIVIQQRSDGRILHQIAATASEDARQRHVAGFAEMLTTIRFRGGEGDGREG